MGHGIADFGNDTGGLVATYTGGRHGVHAAHVGDVAMAQASGCDLNHDFSWARSAKCESVD
jgi:hypothetical protein